MKKNVFARIADAAGEVAFVCIALHAGRAPEHARRSTYEPAQKYLGDCLRKLSSPKLDAWRHKILARPTPGSVPLDELLRRIISQLPKTPTGLLELALTALQLHHACVHIEAGILRSLERAEHPHRELLLEE